MLQGGIKVIIHVCYKGVKRSSRAIIVLAEGEPWDEASIERPHLPMAKCRLNFVKK